MYLLHLLSLPLHLPPLLLIASCCLLSGQAHWFCRLCLAQWVRTQNKRSCPVCRHRFKTVIKRSVGEEDVRNDDPIAIKASSAPHPFSFTVYDSLDSIGDSFHGTQVYIGVCSVCRGNTQGYIRYGGEYIGAHSVSRGGTL